MPPSRRQFLTALGVGVTWLGGCVTDQQNADTVTPVPGDGKTEHTTTDPLDESGVVEDIVVRKAVRYRSTMGSGGVFADGTRQYVVATVRDTGDIDSDTFTFETDTGSWNPGLPETTGTRNYSVAGHEGGPVGTTLGSGNRSFLAFTVPSPIAAKKPRISHEGTGKNWQLSRAATARLRAKAATFSLAELSVPGSVEQGTPLDGTLTVTNTAATDGRFLAALSWPTKLIADDDESHVVEMRVPSGESATARFEIRTQYTTDHPEEIDLRVSGHVSAQRSVSVTDTTTPT